MISTHILDTSSGQPAAGVTVLLEILGAAGWESIGNQDTNDDGRIHFATKPEVGSYRLTFEIESYYSARKQPHFFHNIEISFKIDDVQRKYHVPLLLSPYGYSTYRGS